MCSSPRHGLLDIYWLGFYELNEYIIIMGFIEKEPSEDLQPETLGASGQDGRVVNTVLVSSHNHIRITTTL